MKTTKVIQRLEEMRDEEDYVRYARTISEAIHKLKKYKTKCKEVHELEQKDHNKYIVQKEMRDHYQELFETSVNELRFSNLQISHLKSILDEVHELGDEVVKAVIENGKNRNELDKIIHAKKLFEEL